MEDKVGITKRIGFMYQFNWNDHVGWSFGLNWISTIIVGCFVIGLGVVLVSFGYKMISGSLFVID